MSPLIFLAIPVVVFAIGSTALFLGSRWRDGADFGSRRVPDDLRSVVPMLRDQRQGGWNSDRTSDGARS